MKKVISVLVLTAVLVGCTDKGSTPNTQNSIETVPKGPPSEATKAPQPQKDVREEVWAQLSKEAKEEIVGSWENGKVEEVIIEPNTSRFKGANNYIRKKLLMISFPSKRTAILGDVSVFVDPQTHKIVGYGYRD